MKKPKGLGRGLDALIPPAESQHEDVLFQCPLEAISPYEDQPRKRFDSQKLNELVQMELELGLYWLRQDLHCFLSYDGVTVQRPGPSESSRNTENCREE